jgi:hypothetical protein
MKRYDSMESENAPGLCFVASSYGKPVLTFPENALALRDGD